MKYAAPMLAVVGVVGIGIGTPHLLSRAAFFEIRQVEIVGVHRLTPDQILDAAQLEEHGNLFKRLDGVEQRIANVPGVVNVELERRLPGKLRITIEEREPVAFAVGPHTLVTLDAAARPLPYDPTASDLDLPVIERADPILTSVLGVVRSVDGDFFDAIEFAERAGTGGVALVTGPRRFLLPDRPSREATESLAAVRRQFLDLKTDFAELDARFDGMVVKRVSLP